MDFAIQASVNGLSSGAIYGLIAAGFSLTYQATGRFNFGLGMWVMLGGMLTYTLVSDWGVHPIAALLAIVAFLFGLGWLAELVSVHPFRNSRNDLWIVATLAVGLLFIDAAQLIWGSYPLTVTEYFGSVPLRLFGISVRTQHVLNLVVVVVVFFLLRFHFTGTLQGLAYRAVAADRMTAEIVGVNTRLVEQVSYSAAAALAGLAGFLISPITGAEAHVGTALGFKGFAVAIVGGLAAPRGVLLVGLLYGVLESLISAYLSTGVRDILAFSLMIAVLYLSPFGLFGQPEREGR